ncbi:Smr/MutS family protein [Treponema sp. OMZ 840]|uniref:endonuclease MutS2 n=1 Tax=Treponema sp. OMZ 840 TaxID=244313 RepID=UPI003D94E168
MNVKTLIQLDYTRIRETISSFCISEEGKKSFAERLPLTDKREADRVKARAAAWTKLINAGTDTVLTPRPPVREVFGTLKTLNAVLPIESIYALGLFCRSVIQAKNFFTAQTETELPSGIEALSETASLLPDLNEAASEIFGIIDSSGNLKNLKELQEIRSAIQSIRRSIENLIKSYTSDPKLQNALQSNLPVLRAGRQVLALKADYRGKIRGIVHEVSQTGHTLYIEPNDVVQKNNELIQEEFRLEQEIRRILSALTAKLLPFSENFEKALELMVELDTSRAAALWGTENRCVFAEDADETHPLRIIQARHPLLYDKAVPIDIEFRENHRVLIITGPNTGGKTVAVKTLALFALLNQSGIPLPAETGTRLPFFKSFFADIGDEQNIDQSLSTFSAHMKNVGEMLDKADKDSLIVLDELGSGTDPQEGAAIAMAVLDELIAKNAFVLVTTHHGSLKNYGYTHTKCINASVEFNEETLQPAYRVLMGVPGESRALSIAKKSGLSEKVIEGARLYVEHRQTDISALIRGLTEKYAALEKAEADCRLKESALREKSEKMRERASELKQKEIELREGALKQNKDFLSESRRLLENLVRELREGEITREKTLKVKGFIAELERGIKTESADLEKSRNEAEQSIDNPDVLPDYTHTDMQAAKTAAKTRSSYKKTGSVFKVGTEVYMPHSKVRGVIIGRGKKGEWLVQAGSMKISCKEEDLRPVHSPQNRSSRLTSQASASFEAPAFSVELAPLEKEAASGTLPVCGASAAGASFELRLLGMRLEDAIKALEKHIDMCTIRGLHEFSVIHGKGDGILQEGVHKVLAAYPNIQSYGFAPPQDGGTGKTYVKLG